MFVYGAPFLYAGGNPTNIHLGGYTNKSANLFVQIG